jgi:gamma-glutamyltranspeptidase/glutathione hydrolase
MSTPRFAAPRTAAVAPDVMVATSSALGTAAALATFRRGGTALDAAIAADAALGVVQPMRTGLGGDLFALVERDGEIHGYNGSGGLPAAFHLPEAPMPSTGGGAITVPGLVEAWQVLHDRFGTIELGECLEPAIRLARDGFPLGIQESAEWTTEAAALAPDAHDMFLPGGRAPIPGQLLLYPAQARALEVVAAHGAATFYEGWPGEAIARAAGGDGSAMTVDDLASHRGEWVEPLAPAGYGDWEIVELPPNGQGAVVVGAVTVLNGDAPTEMAELSSSRRVHRQAEAVKAAFTEASTCIADPRAGGSIGRLRDAHWAAEIRRALDGPASTPPPEALPMPGGTVYVAVADGTTTVSLISSNYAFMGSGVVVDEGGFVLHNRGAGFRALTPGPHANNPAPGQRPFHTIIPSLVRRGGTGRWGALGVTGGQFQPQGHVQVLHHLACGLDAQAAIDAPRWHWLGATRLGLEPGLAGLAPELDALGHAIITSPRVPYGAGQMVLPIDGYWYGGADPRQDSLAAGM